MTSPWRAISDRERKRFMCASAHCDEMAAVHFEPGGVGSYYCPDCARRIERTRARSRKTNREIDELEAAFGRVEPR